MNDAGRGDDRPRRIGRYLVERELGRGAFGVVYAAEDPLAARRVAVKVLMAPLRDAAERAKALEEVRLVCRLGFHPHIVPVLDVDFDESDRLYVVMALADGGSLRNVLGNPVEQSYPLPAGEAMRVASQLALGLEACHRRNIIHRDLKPDNVLLSGECWQVADFGLARDLTRATGHAAGTPLYMAPEQALGRPEIRSDVFALGVMLYEMLAGRVPFFGESVGELIGRAAKGEHRPLGELAPGAPAALVDLVHRSITADPEARPADAGVFGAVLRGLDAPAALAPEKLADSIRELTNPDAPFRVRIWADPEEATTTRDLAVVSQEEQASYRVGDRVRLSIASERKGYLTLVNVGPTGNVTVLLPNRHSGLVEISPGVRCTFPEEGAPFRFELQPPSGREVIKAIVTTRPIPHEAFSAPGDADGSGVMRVHRCDDVTRDIVVLDASAEVAALPAGDWSEARLVVDVTGP